jgi:hypothetical protein
MMEYESSTNTPVSTPAVASAKILNRREEIDSGIPWVEKYRPQRYVCHWVCQAFAGIENSLFVHFPTIYSHLIQCDTLHIISPFTC